ncbi:hypothetical protein O181_052857 [Austropuccinia psidii MF-1]|uniref:Uncharacterized protein n=1 Tax=Austropuccinia psidii MF-1 TaxID=1389203 RepID=A0A9Q3E3S7_9BASI|nr:hypothetical protein [Austropuccinia psidii MF-1]
MKSFGQWQRLMVKDDLNFSETKEAENEMDFEMDHNIYMKMLSHLQKTTPNLWDYSKIPHPEDAKVLLNYAKELSTMKKDGYLICNVEPNNLIQYISPHQIRVGRVLHILKVMNEASKGELVVVKRLDVAKSDWDGEEWLNKVFKKLSVVHVRQYGQVEIISACHIIGTAAYRELPNGALGCREPSLMVHVIKKGAN